MYNDTFFKLNSTYREYSINLKRINIFEFIQVNKYYEVSLPFELAPANHLVSIILLLIFENDPKYLKHPK